MIRISCVPNGDVLHFIEETFKHYKTVASAGAGEQLVVAAARKLSTQPGVLTTRTESTLAAGFVAAVAQDRHWTRHGTDTVSA